MFKALCLSGGGVLGFCHLGVIKKLEENKTMNTIDTFVGTSIGALICALLVIGYTADEMMQEFLAVNEDSALRIKGKSSSTYGISDHEYVYAIVADAFMKKGVKHSVTFSETKGSLVIVGTNVTTKRATYFSKETHGGMRVIDALMISVSIPFLFEPVRDGANLYVDGSLTDNYPLDHTVEMMKTRFGFPDAATASRYVVGSNLKTVERRKIGSFGDFVYGLFACNSRCRCSPVGEPGGLTVDVFASVSGIDFHIDRKKRFGMMKAGYDAMEAGIRERLALKRGRRNSL